MADVGPAVQSHAKVRRGFRISPQYLAPILITCILIGAQFYYHVLESPWKTGLAIVCAMAAELLLGRLSIGKWPQLASAYITGISVGILVRSPYLWPYAVCSLLSISSKYVLRVKGRHIWNPSNFGIVAMLLLAPAAVASLSIQWDNRVPAMLVIWILGSIIIARVKRFHICATYVISFLAFAALRAAIRHESYLAEIAPITGPMYQLFIFFMITDPKTTVKSKMGQIATTFGIALVECIFRMMQGVPNFQIVAVNAPFFALFLVGPAANLIEIYGAGRKKGKVEPRMNADGRR